VAEVLQGGVFGDCRVHPADHGRWILKLSASGNVEWQKTYSDLNNDYTHSIQQTTDGGYIMAGDTYTVSTSSFDFRILKLDASGNVEWHKIYDSTNNDYTRSIQQTTDGGYIVAGNIWYEDIGGSVYDFLVLKLDASGDIEWQKIYGENGWAKSIRQATDGGYVVAGWTEVWGMYLWVLKLDPSGNIIWQKTYDGGWAESIRQTTDGGFIVGGVSGSLLSPTSSWDCWVLKLDANGNIGASCLLVSDTTATSVNASMTVATFSVTGVNSAALAIDAHVTGANPAAVMMASEQCAGTFVNSPHLAYSSSIASDCGNYDGVIDQREKIELSVALESLGAADAYSVGGVLSTPTKGVSMVSDTASFSNIPSGFTGTSLDPFVFKVSASVPCGTVIDFTLGLICEDVSGEPFSNSASFQLQVGEGGTPVCNPNCGCPPVSSWGDTDANGCTDGLDLMRMARSFGATCGEGDFLNDTDLDNSGWVDGGDLDALVGNFGSGCGQ
jgi:hypothetical protein